MPPLLVHRGLPAGESKHKLYFSLQQHLDVVLQVVTDGLRRADGRYDGRVGDRLLPPLHTEIKEDQWLGGAVTSQGEIVGHL